MQLAILTIIAICSVVGVIILWEVRESIRGIPSRIVDLIFKPLRDEIASMKAEIQKIKNELPDQGDN